MALLQETLSHSIGLSEDAASVRKQLVGYKEPNATQRDSVPESAPSTSLDEEIISRLLSLQKHLNSIEENLRAIHRELPEGMS